MPDEGVISLNSTIIGLILDIYYVIFFIQKTNKNERSYFLSLLCFRGLLLLTDDLNKGTRYFQILLNDQSIDNILKISLHGLL